MNSDRLRRRAAPRAAGARRGASFACTLLLLLPALAPAAEFSVTLAPAPFGLTVARFNLWLPDSDTPAPAPLRVVLGASNYEAGTQLYRHPAWREFAAREHCAILLYSLEWADPRFKLARGEPAAAALEQGLTQLATLSGHAELAALPWVLTGLSQSGWQAHSLANVRPARTLAILPFHASTGPHGPEDFIHPGTQDVPALLAMGSREAFPIEVLAFARTGAMRGRPWTYFLQLGVPHHEVGPQDFPLRWLGVIFSLRLAPDGALRRIDPETGWRADYMEYSPQPTDRRPYRAEIFRSGTRPLDPRQGSLLWLPDEATARAWQAAVLPSASPSLSP